MLKKLRYGIFALICSSLVCLGVFGISAVNGELSQSSQRLLSFNKVEPILDNAKQKHILERLSFGVNSAQINQVNKLGIEAYIQSQLNPQSANEPAQLENYLAGQKLANQSPFTLQNRLFTFSQEQKKTGLSPQREVEIKTVRRELLRRSRKEAVQAHIARGIYSNWQLQEVMTDFWTNHFNVFAAKSSIPVWMKDYENEIRANSLGSFRALLEATASHPAMLIYLDNQQNRVYRDRKTNKIVESLNENYARELMELHTLGIDGGYTQADIMALSRIFTGWRLNIRDIEETENSFFDLNNHDQSEKVFLGQKFPPDGIAEGKKALDMLAAHPATARFISYKLAQYFVADQPPSALVNRLAQKFLASDGNIRMVMDTLIHSQEFNDPEYYGKKFKTPYQYLISLVRMSEIKQPDLNRVEGMLNNLSMPVYLCNQPTGYKNTQDVWLNPQAMLGRIGYGTVISKGILNRQEPINLATLQSNFGTLSEHTTKVLERNAPRQSATLLMGSPEAMYR